MAKLPTREDQIVLTEKGVLCYHIAFLQDIIKGNIVLTDKRSAKMKDYGNCEFIMSHASRIIENIIGEYDR